MVASGILLAACNTDVGQHEISAKPLPQAQMSVASRATSICAKHAPNDEGAIEDFLVNGFHPTSDKRLVAISNRYAGEILESGGVVVQVGKQGREFGCVIGAVGMTPEQSYNLALPWVSQYNAQTNAERGQGLSKKVVQAWGIHEENRIVYLSALKSWDVLDTAGAAARLIYIER